LGFLEGTVNREDLKFVRKRIEYIFVTVVVVTREGYGAGCEGAGGYRHWRLVAQALFRVVLFGEVGVDVRGLWQTDALFVDCVFGGEYGYLSALAGFAIQLCEQRTYLQCIPLLACHIRLASLILRVLIGIRAVFAFGKTVVRRLYRFLRNIRRMSDPDTMWCWWMHRADRPNSVLGHIVGTERAVRLREVAPHPANTGLIIAFVNAPLAVVKDIVGGCRHVEDDAMVWCNAFGTTVGEPAGHALFVGLLAVGMGEVGAFNVAEDIIADGIACCERGERGYAGVIEVEEDCCLSHSDVWKERRGLEGMKSDRSLEL
jgi:hypothetical protein